ncbi:F-actin-monooxygenase MICAL2 [Exaiptasia diaphana]|uniref:Calponin-homology (CH) domain-containing protein n=1 Tax=Exaiptasia diaphana TaxID=2652724 RepID=A0A913YLR7_EXADI|nr:F-actin-monooxygenase MICAL2 [Exaiptasia diaphana]XP_028516064.1 F-actin-monooxygenase MICAL2 [Exaiptasia diaphana]KXJ06152.1 Protein-methionine sulfoxide oxidase MICAL3 [Exaiptasia diaphana]
MSTSWKDGLALCGIIHRFRPDLIDFDSLNPSEAEKNNQLAFQVAEEHLGIQPQVSAKEIACASVPDQLTILSYVTQYYETFKNEAPGMSITTILSYLRHRAPRLNICVAFTAMAM